MTTPIKPPTHPRSRVYRGGSWNGYGPSRVRALSRCSDAVSGRDVDLGFRCAQRGARQPLKVTP